MSDEQAKRLAGVLAVFVIAGLAYLITAFILWELNPYEWSAIGRLTYVIGTIVSISTALKALPNEE